MAMSSITVGGITPDLSILGGYQNFIYITNSASLILTNNFVPTISIPAVMNFETRNTALSGFRWTHTTLSTDTFGTLALQSFINASPTGTDIITFSATGIDISAPVNFGAITITGGTWEGNVITVPYGGTGVTSTTPYSVICGGTTSTGALQSVASVGTSGQVLTSQGAGALPAFANPAISCCSILLNGNATTTSLSANVYAKVQGTTTTAIITANFSAPVSNRIVWTGTNSINVCVQLVVSHSHTNTATISFTLYKNGTSTPYVAPCSTRQGSNSLEAQSVCAIVPMATNDYLEIWAQSSSNTTLTVVDMQFIAYPLSLV